MTTSLTESLPDLPKPKLIDDINFEVILQRRKAEAITAADALGLNLRDYLEQPFEIGTILLENASYNEMQLRSRVNHVYRAGLLWFATGTNLDHVADRRGVTRLDGEPDVDLKERVRLKVRGSSAAGPDDWWRAHAMAADERVEDVAVTRIKLGPDNQERQLIELAILAQTTDGIPTPEILSNVETVVTSRRVRPLGTFARVVPATTRGFNVKGRIWLLPDSVMEIFDGLEARLRDAFAEVRALGFDITPSWVSKQLQAAGVQRVELIDFPGVTVGGAEAPRLDAVTLEFAGYAR